MDNKKKKDHLTTNRELFQIALEKGRLDENIICFLERLNHIHGVGTRWSCGGHSNTNLPYLLCFIKRPPGKVLNSLLPKIKKTFRRYDQRIDIEFGNAEIWDDDKSHWMFRYVRSHKKVKTQTRFTEADGAKFFERLTETFEACLSE